MFRHNTFAILCCLVEALFVGSAHAQETSAGMTGRVTDPSGGSIAGASVNATDQERATVWSTKSNEDGIYAFPRVPVGIYEIRIEASGFKTFARRDIQLEINQRARVDAEMEVGAVTDRVDVTSEAAPLQTETTQVGAVVASNTIVNTPLVSRNFVQLTMLAPGVTNPDPSSMLNGARSTGGGRPYVNGNRKEANNFLLDGVDNNQVADNLTAYQPNVDAIQEFKMITNNASAEFGNFQGGIVNVTLKSGANGFHGNLFEFFRNDKLNANSWSRNWSGTRRPFQRWNIFGGTFGGRIIRDKLFFFMDYQGTRIASPGSTSSMTVIPAEFRAGDFSRLLSEKGIQLYNPHAVNADRTRQAFPGNQVPRSLMSPVALKLFGSPDLYPLPSNGLLQNNYFYVASSYINSDQGDLKLDYKPTNADFFTARYSNGRQDQPGTNTFPLLYNTFSTQPFKAGVANWTRTLSPSVVNEARLGVNYIMLNNGGEDKGLGNIAANLGIAGVPTGLMQIRFTNGLTTNVGNANVGAQTRRADTTYHYADNLTIIRGRHMMKTGGQLLRQHNNSFYAGNNGRTGFIAFNGQYTWGPNPSSAVSKGFAEADFMLGYPSSLGRGLSTGTWGHRKTIYGVYFQDDWRVSNSVTLNLGLRWEYHTPLVEVKDRQSNFDPFSGKPMLAAKDGNSRSLYYPFKKDFQPRVGFAWTPKALGGATVIRGAYTISSFMEGTGTNLRLPLNPPFNTEYEAIYTDPTTFGSTLSAGLTALQSADPYRNATIRLWDPFVRPARTQQWNFTIERQLPLNNVLTVGYVGQHGTHLVVPMPYLQRQMTSPGVSRPSPYLSGNPVLAAISQISGTETNGNQRYDSLQATLRRRLAGGLEYQLSYTWSKGMSDSIGYYGDGGQASAQSAYWQNLYDRKSEWGPSYFDLAHNFVASYVYSMPFGKGKRFGGSWNPVLNGVLGQWQMGGILMMHTGFPLTITANDVSGTRSRGPRANRTKDGEGAKKIGPGVKWLDTTAFAQPASGAFGSSGVGVVRGPGMQNFSLSMQKTFPIAEARRVEFRAESYNLTNTPIFETPSTAVTSANFGEIRSAQGQRSVQFALKLFF